MSFLKFKEEGGGLDGSAAVGVVLGPEVRWANNEAFESGEQRAAFQRFIRSGGGFLGIHSSTGSERQWDYFQELQGAKFYRHAPLQRFTIKVRDVNHPATSALSSPWVWEDECYFFSNLNPRIRVLLEADTKTLRDAKLKTMPGQKVNGVYPLAWYHEFEGSRVFYTSLGHKIEHYSDPAFLQHLLGGIRWVTKTAPPSQTSVSP